MNELEKGNKYFGALIEIRKQLGVQYQESAQSVLGYIYQIATISGVIAGFGFTAIDHANRILFVCGESALLLCIIATLVTVKKYWMPGLQITAEYLEKMNKTSSELRSAISDGDEEVVTRIMKNFNSVSDVSSEKQEKSKIIERTLNHLVLLLSIGCILLMLSFIFSN